MFEKDAEEYAHEHCCDACKNLQARYKQVFKDGAEFGYNKANEWHYVKDEGTPIHEGHYLVCLQNKDHDIFDCWILFDKDIGWYSLQVRLVDIYAWKEIELPKLPKESEIKREMFPEITLPEGSAEFVNKAIADADKHLKENE